jgi:hypothetical protein
MGKYLLKIHLWSGVWVGLFTTPRFRKGPSILKNIDPGTPCVLQKFEIPF